MKLTYYLFYNLNRNRKDSYFMTKKCINSHYREFRSGNNSVSFKNDLYRIYKKQFDKFFRIDAEIKTFDELKETYVPNMSFETEIDEFRNSIKDNTTICIGSPGTGKTTSILHSFNLDPNEDVAKIDYSKKELVFYVKTDDLDIDPQNPNNKIITEQINSICKYLLKQFPNSRDKLRCIAGKKELYDSLRRRAPFVFDSPDLFDPAQVSKIMNQEVFLKSSLRFVKTNYPFVYGTNLLGFILNNNFDKIQNFIIILDDIELYNYNVQYNLILSFLRFKEMLSIVCLQDGLNTEGFFTKLLISLRKDSYHRFFSNRVIDSFPIDRHVFINIDGLSLSELFERRFIYYTSIYEKQYGNLQKAFESYQILKELSKKLSDQYGILIKKICCYNIQKALVVFADILTNRYYVQKNSHRNDLIDLSVEKFILSNHSVIRAISCRENSVFFGDASDGFIPNILLTSLNDDYSVECLLIMQYYSTHLEPYGIGAESFRTTMANWQSVFGENITNRLFVALKYLFKNKVIRRFVWESASINMYDGLKIDDDSLLYLSPMGEQIYELLCRNSEALELFREAAWRDYNHKKYSVLPSSELLPNTPKEQSKQDVLFNDLLDYISYLADNESAFIKTVQKNNNLDKYLSLFGFETVSARLFFGVKNTIERLGINKEYPEVKNTFSQTENIVIALREFINKKNTIL